MNSESCMSRIRGLSRPSWQMKLLDCVADKVALYTEIEP